jgi:pyocin large subunit-like protein
VVFVPTGHLADYFPEPASGVREWINFEDHYQTHVVENEEWPVQLSEGDYAQAADDFIAVALTNHRLHWFAERNGSVTIYDAKTNDFAVLASDGRIVSYFHPEDKQSYYERTLRRQMQDGFVIDRGGPS